MHIETRAGSRNSLGKKNLAAARPPTSNAAKSLICNAVTGLPFSCAGQVKHGLTRVCGRFRQAINKVIHRKSEFLTKGFQNQALGAESGSFALFARIDLAQKKPGPAY
ncbi:hypothetical protein [Melaminivora sp.]